MDFDNYEDEIDRMQKRSIRKKKGRFISKAQEDKSTACEEDDEDWEYLESLDDLDDLNDRKNQDNRKNLDGRDAPDDLETLEIVDIFAYEDPEPIQNYKNDQYKKRRRFSKKFSFAACLLVFAAVTIAGFFYHRSQNYEWWTIAVFGVDSRDGNLNKGALADVEIVASVNKNSGEIRLISVFRDSYLQINNEGEMNKINEAYFKGSHALAVEALETNLDLKMDDYATFNWKSVADAINVLGGIELEITDSEFAYINSFITETVESTGVGSFHLEHAGMNHLDGVQAVAYARLRLMDTDFNRTERQRKVLGQALEKAKAADKRTITTLIGTVFPQVSTSIGVNDLMTLGKNMKKFYISQTSGFPFSHSEMKIGKKSCVIPTTLVSNVSKLHEYLYDEEAYEPSGVVKKISLKIAETSGLSEEGKDIESGKNAGVSADMPEVSDQAGQKQ